MLNQSLGLIEVQGLAAAVEAADAAVKSANVELIGYELTKGGGWVVVKIQGNVSAVEAAIQAAWSAASRVSEVIAMKVIPRPGDGLEMVVCTEDNVGDKPVQGEPVKEAPAQPAAVTKETPVVVENVKPEPKKETPKKEAAPKKAPAKKAPAKEEPKKAKPKKAAPKKAESKKEEPKAAEPAGEVSGVTLVEFKPTVTVVKPVEISIAAEDIEKKD